MPEHYRRNFRPDFRGKKLKFMLKGYGVLILHLPELRGVWLLMSYEAK